MGRGERREDGGKNLGPSSIGEGYIRVRGDSSPPPPIVTSGFPQVCFAFPASSYLLSSNYILREHRETLALEKWVSRAPSDLPFIIYLPFPPFLSLLFVCFFSPQFSAKLVFQKI